MTELVLQDMHRTSQDDASDSDAVTSPRAEPSPNASEQNLAAALLQEHRLHPELGIVPGEELKLRLSDVVRLFTQ